MYLYIKYNILLYILLYSLLHFKTIYSYPTVIAI